MVVKETNIAGEGLLDIFRDDPRLLPLIGPGAPFEYEEIVLDGVPLRSFSNGPKSLIEVFQMNKAFSDLVHIVNDSERYTFADVRQEALTLALALKTRYGVVKGDRVGIVMRNYPEFVTIFWASVVLGAIAVPLNSFWTGYELKVVIDDCDPKVVFADADRLKKVTGDDIGAMNTEFIAVRTNPDQWKGCHYSELTHGKQLQESEFAQLDTDDPIVLMYTSGTTGKPKGALTTSRAQIANAMNGAFMGGRELILSGREPAEPRQSGAIQAMPIFHVGGVGATVMGSISGSKIVMFGKWNVQEYLELAEQEQVTSIGGVPTMMRAILDYPELDKFKLTMTNCGGGGASIPPDLPLRMVETFGPSMVVGNGYGLTETTAAVVSNFGREYLEHPSAIGRANLTADVRVCDPDGKRLLIGERGELCFRSPQVALGYWKNPEATATSFIDGWFHSGDLGYVDDEGYVYVVDRIKDVVIRGGENVYCAEVESTILEFPGIANVAVVGVPDEILGERVCAVIAPQSGATPSAKEIKAFTATRLAAFKCPDFYLIVDEIPQTATGKHAKNLIRELLIEQADKIQTV
jgi:long-chain acyl-CoA synthetase